MKIRLGILTVLVLVALAAALYLHGRRGASESLPIAEQEAALGGGDIQSDRLRVLVGPGDPVRGAADAVVTLVSFCDFKSRGCKHAARTLLEAVLAYPTELRVMFKPLPAKNDPQSVAAAEAALAASEQGKFWEMHDLLFADPNALDRAGLEQKAQRLGLDMPRFRASVDAHEQLPTIEESIAYAAKLGVQSAPALFLNGVRLEDAEQPFVHLKPRIDSELRRVRSLMQEQGLSSAEVYPAMMRGARPVPLPRAREP